MTTHHPHESSPATEQSLGERLVATRVASGLTQAQWAVLVGVPAEQVARDERTAYRGMTARAARRYLDLLARDPRLRSGAALAATTPVTPRKITSHYRQLRLAPSHRDAHA